MCKSEKALVTEKYELTVLRCRGAREHVKNLTQKVLFQFEGNYKRTALNKRQCKSLRGQLSNLQQQ